MAVHMANRDMAVGFLYEAQFKLQNAANCARETKNGQEGVAGDLYSVIRGLADSVQALSSLLEEGDA